METFFQDGQSFFQLFIRNDKGHEGSYHVAEIAA